jgi:sulfatase maturation enzyme AslB (radical SAM superfamily)
MDKSKISIINFKKAFLKFIKISKNPELVFLGGEPTADRDLIKMILEARKIKKDIPVTIFTNGTLIDKKLAGCIKNNKINLIISMDGNRLSNNHQKKFISEKGSAYDIVLSNLKKYDLIKLSTVNMVVTKKILKSLNKNIKHLHSLGFNSIGFNIDYSDNWEKKDKKELKRQIKFLFLGYARMLRNNEEILRFSNLYEVFDFLKNRTVPECKNLILFPDGKFYMCDKIAMADKKIKKKFVIKRDIIADRKIFFKHMRDKGLDNNQLFCKIGLYLYFRYYKNLDGKKLNKKLNDVFDIQQLIKDEITKYAMMLMKSNRFRFIHRI